ncbi:CoA pyrophosphatase [Ramlibacter sp. PS3R-8]|uniref:CoA pyrophosphatase n=1 Tax=Ramlibacter sp. PS3R-8 TaxID=3133437 RepID=UPI0030995520
MPIDPSPAIPPDTPLSKLPNFDPREVPVVGVDAHLPPVPPAQLRPDALRLRFARPPAWEQELRSEPRFTDRQPAHAAVLVPIVMRERPMVLLTERAVRMTTHSGQVAFPGGKRDDTDLGPADTALREAHEEIGLDRGLAEVLGDLPTYTTGTMFIVTPVIALVQPDYRLALNALEVADAFEVPLDFLMDPANHRRHIIEFSGTRREWFSMPYAEAGKERFIWGATAGMLRNFYRFLAA